jgi:hypothetical protein
MSEFRGRVIHPTMHGKRSVGQSRRQPRELVFACQAGPGPNRSSWSRRIRGHGDFENFPAIPVFAKHLVLFEDCPVDGYVGRVGRVVRCRPLRASGGRSR